LADFDFSAVVEQILNEFVSERGEEMNSSHAKLIGHEVEKIMSKYI
jgi:hypothetical protein